MNIQAGNIVQFSALVCQGLKTSLATSLNLGVEVLNSLDFAARITTSATRTTS